MTAGVRGAPTAAPPEVAVTIRPLVSVDDARACVDLQRDVWGWDQPEVVPATLLHVVDYVGGLAAGAFDSGGTMLGFVFGITGVRDGTVVHWSHMLGVRESARNAGIGRSLKEYQRRILAERGVRCIYWTFDPLQAKNAYLNLNRLGARVVDYVPDMYGTTESPLHLGLATDRIIVALATGGHEIERERVATSDHLPVMTPFPRLNDFAFGVGGSLPATALIEIPTDILSVLARSVSTAHTWRLGVRDHFRWALANGYRVRGLHRHDTAGDERAFYVVTREPQST